MTDKEAAQVAASLNRYEMAVLEIVGTAPAPVPESSIVTNQSGIGTLASAGLIFRAYGHLSITADGERVRRRPDLMLDGEGA